MQEFERSASPTRSRFRIAMVLGIRKQTTVPRAACGREVSSRGHFLAFYLTHRAKPVSGARHVACSASIEEPR
jgi:hypothetical protein